ncbi:clathrin heavy chain linker domain-containing protein 1-like isoform 2-T2 [Anableps anableps]
MNKEQNDTEDSEMNPVIDIDLCESDRTFFRSLYKFIEEEKKYLQCPEEGANELRYIIYRSAFNKVIGRASAYRRLLLDIKFEYDGTIREMLRREDDDATSRLQSLLRWAAHIRDRTSILQNQTAELQEEVRRQKSAQSRLVPGLTLAQSEDPEVLEDHLEHLETQRDVLLDRKCQCCPAEVQTHLTFDLQEAELHRNRLRDQNQQLITWFRRLKLVGERLRSWEETGQAVPLEDLLGSTIQNLLEIRTKSLQDEGSDEDSCIPAELLEEEEPTGQDESRLLKDHLDRFLELLRSSQLEAAALHAARSPVLRNSDTMEMFRGVQGPPGSAPPPLLFFRALLVTVATGHRMSAGLSLQGVGVALRHGEVQLVAHGVTLNKLTFTEELGDALTEHAQNHPAVADLCLALASTVYQACGQHQKTALSMCRRGLVHAAVEVIKHQKLTAEDSLWILSRSPSLSLLQLLTSSQGGQAAILSVGGTCAFMLVDSSQQQVALELLDGLLRRGPGVLQDAILEDSSSSVDVWEQVASLCSDLKRDDLRRAIRSVLLGQDGTGARSPDLEGARLMEHVFL